MWSINSTSVFFYFLYFILLFFFSFILKLKSNGIENVMICFVPKFYILTINISNNNIIFIIIITNNTIIINNSINRSVDRLEITDTIKIMTSQKKNRLEKILRTSVGKINVFSLWSWKKSLRIFLRREKFEKKSTFRGLGLKKIARYI